MPTQKRKERERVWRALAAGEKPEYIESIPCDAFDDALVQLHKRLQKDDGRRAAEGAKLSNAQRHLDSIKRLTAWGESHRELMENANSTLSARQVAIILKSRGLDTRTVGTIAKDVQRVRKIRSLG